MNFAMIGAGRMGAGMVCRLLKAGQGCSVFDINESALQPLKALGAKVFTDLPQLVSSLQAPRAIWIMVPLHVVEETINRLSGLLAADDILIDGGNCHYKDDIRRSMILAKKGINFIDVGTSGGIWGEERGYCLMIGGDKKIYESLISIFRVLAPGSGQISRTLSRSDPLRTSEEGFLYCGPNGAGHFAKMVHNGIEYGMMQAYAEGFDLLFNASRLKLDNGNSFNFDVKELAETWRRGSVVSSWLLDLTAEALLEDPSLSGFSGQVEDTGEGRWTLNAAVEAAVPVPVLAASIFARFRSRVGNMFGEKLLSSMRKKFGGHVERR